MHLVEVLVAGSVFAIASGGSMSLWSATAVKAQQMQAHKQLEQRIEQDRLRLQTLWRNQASAGSPLREPSQSGCTLRVDQLLTMAAAEPAPTPIQRELKVSGDGQSLLMRWTAPGDHQLRRQRLVTPAGLGLCGLAQPQAQADATTPADSGDPALTDSQVEGLTP